MILQLISRKILVEIEEFSYLRNFSLYLPVLVPDKFNDLRTFLVWCLSPDLLFEVGVVLSFLDGRRFFDADFFDADMFLVTWSAECNGTAATAGPAVRVVFDP